jgi:membrane protein
MKRIRILGKVLKAAGRGFMDDNAFKLAASLSYYTVFALGPILIIIISLAGFFFGKEAVQGRLYMQMNGLVGNTAALQIQDIIRNIQASELTTAGAIAGGLIFFIGATGVFTEIQDSINYIWSVKAKPKKEWLKFLFNRLISFSLIVGLSFVLLVSLIINTILDVLSENLVRLLSDYTYYLFYVINSVIVFIVISFLFAVIFKVLPDARIKWRDASMGAFFTACLFLFGKFLINYYIARANLGITYGTAASIIIILVWVYYSSIILYFGAEFTKMYALQAGSGIRPKDTAVFIIKKEAMEIPDSRLG